MQIKYLDIPRYMNTSIQVLSRYPKSNHVNMQSMVGIGPLRLSCGVWFGRKIGDLMRAFGQV